MSYDITQIQEYINETAETLALNSSISIPDAERRAAKFLEAQAMIADTSHILRDDRIKLTSIQTAVYAEQMSKGTAKTVTENKLAAEASAEYTKAREDLERIENDLSYLKAYYDIFQNAHVFYRNLAKGE